MAMVSLILDLYFVMLADERTGYYSSLITNDDVTAPVSVLNLFSGVGIKDLKLSLRVLFNAL